MKETSFSSVPPFRDLIPAGICNKLLALSGGHTYSQLCPIFRPPSQSSKQGNKCLYGVVSGFGEAKLGFELQGLRAFPHPLACPPD